MIATVGYLAFFQSLFRVDTALSKIAGLVRVGSSPGLYIEPSERGDMESRSQEDFMAPVQSIAIFVPLIIALPIILGTIVIHGLAMLAVVHLVRYEHRLGHAGIRFGRDLLLISGVTLLALLAHLVDIAIWALVFEFCGEFPQLSTAVYHSAVNYTSLGYGDIVMSAPWRLLGPLETADGMLMFGISTAMIFAIAQRLAQIRFKFEDS